MVFKDMFISKSHNKARTGRWATRLILYSLIGGVVLMPSFSTSKNNERAKANMEETRAFEIAALSEIQAELEPLLMAPDLDELVEIRPEDFGGVDICLRDTSGVMNECARNNGVIKEDGGEPERICKVSKKALRALKKARAKLKKIDPNLEIMVISSYRSPEYQQCLWVQKTDKGHKCKRSVCGPRDNKTRKRLACREYDLDDPRYSGIFDRCPHVNANTVDACVYDRSEVQINERNQLDMTILEDCRKSKDPNHKLPEGWFYHPCTCRFTSWDSDIRRGGARTGIFTHGGSEEVQAFIKAMRATGWVNNVPKEWWHFRYAGK